MTRNVRFSNETEENFFWKVFIEFEAAVFYPFYGASFRLSCFLTVVDPVSGLLIRGHSSCPLQLLLANTTDRRTQPPPPPPKKQKSSLSLIKTCSHPLNAPFSGPHLVSLTGWSSLLQQSSDVICSSAHIGLQRELEALGTRTLKRFSGEREASGTMS